MALEKERLRHINDMSAKVKQFPKLVDDFLATEMVLVKRAIIRLNH